MNHVEQPGGSQLIRAMNRAKVLNCIRTNPYTTRPQLAAETGLAMSSITNIVNHLIAARLVTEREPESTGLVGRRALPLVLDADWNRLVCATVHKGSMDVALIGIRGRVFEEEVLPLTDKGAPGEELARLLSTYMEQVAVRHSGRILAVLVAQPGMSLEEGRRVHAVELRWRDVDLLTPIRIALSVPAYVVNVSIARAISVMRTLSEYDEETENIAFLDLDGGVGLVQIIGGRVQDGVLGEIGHTTVDRRGERCFCGNIGCLEGMCSPERALAMARERLTTGGCKVLCTLLDGREPQFSDLLLAEQFGDLDTRALLGECGEYLGIAMTSAVHLLHPSVLYLSGGALTRSKTAQTAAQAWLMAHAYPQLVEGLVCRSVDIDGDGVRLGLLDYALDRLFDYRSEDFVVAGG